jgi:purine-nucleoside phosphorylase
MTNAEKLLLDFGAETGLILGSGLAPLASHFESHFELPYDELPGFPKPKVSGHAGHFVGAECHGTKVLVGVGRVHLYEGWEVRQVVRGIHAMHAAGVRHLILTNAAGAVNPGVPPGSWMMIRDHINLTGHSPLRGSSQFVDMTEVYSRRMRAEFQFRARELGWNLPEGVYAAMPGPQYETPAEINMLRVLGADAVGMSTVPEAIQARALGLELAAFSCITNLGAGLSKHPLNHKDVLATGNESIGVFAKLLHAAIPNLGINF